MGDTFFNGLYPYIDSSTGGKITGMIAAADKVSARRQLHPDCSGARPARTKPTSAKFDGDMLVTARERLQN